MLWSFDCVATRTDGDHVFDITYHPFQSIVVLKSGSSRLTCGVAAIREGYACGHASFKTLEWNNSRATISKIIDGQP